MFSPRIWWIALTMNRSGSEGPDLADVLLWCEAAEGLQAAGKVVRIAEEVSEMAARLVVAVVVVGA